MAYHFNNRISIIGITEEMNDEGGFEEVEAEIAKPWADIKTMRASEFETMGFTVTNVPIRFIIRYRKGIELDHKIKYNGDMYKIESIENDDGKNHTLTIFANRNEM
ncbi:phage head closure protein [Staphylococcus saprophyticus]|nr:phage head closure protein [Staphylococcus saprophyticus]